MIVWDRKGVPPPPQEETWCWKNDAPPEGAGSIARYVEQHATRLRAKYLAFVHDLGEAEVDGRSVAEHLALEPGTSYWWLTLLAEQSPWKSPAVIDAIHGLALEEIVAERRPGELRLVSADRKLHETLRDLCRKLDIRYEWRREGAPPRGRTGWRGLYRRLPEPARAFCTAVRYLGGRWRFRRGRPASWFGGGSAVFACTYLDIGAEAAGRRTFHSPYWGEWPGLLRDLGLRANWLQLYNPCPNVPTAAAAFDLVDGFNERPGENGAHALLESYLSAAAVGGVCQRWLRLRRAAGRLGGLRGKFRPRGLQISLWPFLADDWRASLGGSAAVTNLFWMELFDRCLRELPRQRLGFYLCENLAWERILIQAWRRHGHGRLVGVAHATICFWHLNYSFDPRTLRASGPCRMPQPDQLAVNGRAAEATCLESGFPRERLVEAEALRYGHLGRLPAAARGRPPPGPARMLILGDFMPPALARMLGLLEQAEPAEAGRFLYTVKPHPDAPFDADDHPGLRLATVTRPLAEVLPDFDLAYASNTTSAAVDAYLAGLPVIVVLDAAELNFSPLRGQPGVSFVSTAGELAEAMAAAGRPREPNTAPGDFFFLNPQFPRWKRLLEG